MAQLWGSVDLGLVDGGVSVVRVKENGEKEILLLVHYGLMQDAKTLTTRRELQRKTQQIGHLLDKLSDLLFSRHSLFLEEVRYWVIEHNEIRFTRELCGVWHGILQQFVPDVQIYPVFPERVASWFGFGGLKRLDKKERTGKLVREEFPELEGIQTTLDTDDSLMNLLYARSSAYKKTHKPLFENTVKIREIKLRDPQ